MGANQSTQIASQVSHHLALSLLRELSHKDPANIFISPFSIANAVSMLYCGTASETACEISEVMGLKDISREDLTNAFDVFLTSLEKSSEAFSLECANALLIQEGFPAKEEYKYVLQKSFRAMFMQVDIAKDPNSAVGRVNGWVEDKTRGMIGTLVDRLDPLVVVILLNAVYFKGRWEHQFSKDSTRLQNFYNHGDKDQAKEVDMMHLKERFYYAEEEAFSALQLPYKGQGHRHVDSPAPFSSRLGRGDGTVDTQFLEDLTKKMRKACAEPSRKGADLSGMSDCADLNVSDVVHKAVIEVNEEGTVAAAATAVMIQNRCMVYEPEFTVDHPFLFMIIDTNSNVNLFTGKIVEM
ncbi:leukocyte elastase inhibitor [Caerostris extrusa]|uniref:Leukocyte elastase inhibitor n=1 Tax=Caerostris extrusa TaxID=172846 RepID=A0AAV4MNZ3_CAEEX|nr:leukocyte elastase inhibitor [Caerostris extrusa]